MSNEKNRSRSLFSNRLRMLRKASNMTQKQVAQKLSIDRSTYAYYEIDKTKPDYDTLLHISRIFDVSVDFLLGREQEEPGAPLVFHDDYLPATGDMPSYVSSLSPEEQTFLSIYRQLDAMQRGAVLQFALEHRYRKKSFPYPK